MIDLAIYSFFALVGFVIVVDLLVHDVRGRRAVDRANAINRARYVAECAEAKRRGQLPPFPPNRLVWA